MAKKNICIYIKNPTYTNGEVSGMGEEEFPQQSLGPLPLGNAPIYFKESTFPENVSR